MLGKIDLGYSMKCKNCKYSCIKYKGRKIENIFCGKFQNDILLSKYKNMGVCLFFESI